MSDTPVKDIKADIKDVEFVISELKELSAIVNDGLSKKDKEILDLSELVSDGYARINQEIIDITDHVSDRLHRIKKDIERLQESDSLWKIIAITALCTAIAALAFLTAHVF